MNLNAVSAANSDKYTLPKYNKDGDLIDYDCTLGNIKSAG